MQRGSFDESRTGRVFLVEKRWTAADPVVEDFEIIGNRKDVSEVLGEKQVLVVIKNSDDRALRANAETWEKTVVDECVCVQPRVITDVSLVDLNVLECLQLVFRVI